MAPQLAKVEAHRDLNLGASLRITSGDRCCPGLFIGNTLSDPEGDEWRK